jgi:hypothetical protein
MKIAGWCLIVGGLAMSYSSSYTVVVWPRAFRWDLKEWAIGLAGLVIAVVGAVLVWAP